MNIKKFRIGNILISMDKNKLIKLVYLNEDGFCKCKLMNNVAKEFTVDINKLIPIPITENLLKKLEYNRNNDITVRESNLMEYYRYYGSFKVYITKKTDVDWIITIKNDILETISVKYIKFLNDIQNELIDSNINVDL